MDLLWRELKERNIPIRLWSVPGRLSWRTIRSTPGKSKSGATGAREVQALRQSLSRILRRQGSMSPHPAGLLVSETLPLRRHALQLCRRRAGRRRVGKALADNPVMKRPHAPIADAEFAAAMAIASGGPAMNLGSRNAGPHLALCPSARAELYRSGQGALAHSPASELLLVSYALYLTWGSVVPRRAAGVDGHQLPGGALDQRGSRRCGKLWAGLGFNLLLLAAFKYVPGIAVAIPFAFAAEVLAPGLTARHLVLEFPGDELSVRRVPRQRARSLAVEFRALHGVFPGGHLRADLPHARHAAAVPLG